MTSFKTFLAEIDHDDSVFSKWQSENVARITLDGTWQPLPIKGSFWKPGYKILWKENGGGAGYLLAVAYGKNIVIYMELDNFGVKVPGGHLTGLDVDSLSSRPSVRGTGLVYRTYESLVESGQVLFSSNLQTTGSRKLWEKLVQSPHVVPFVLAQGAAARWYQRKYGDEEEQTANVLLTGPMNRMQDEAYADSETRWVALPKDLSGLDKLREGALDIT